MYFLHFEKTGEDCCTIYNVSKTVITWCIPLSIKCEVVKAIKAEALDCLKEKHDSRISNGRLEDNNTYINIALHDENDKCIAKTVETVIYQKKDKGEFVRINTSKICSQLQDMFWFTSACVIMNEDKDKSDKIKFDASKFTEQILIEPVANEDAEKSGIIIRPYKRITEDFQYVSQDEKGNNIDANQINRDVCNFLRSINCIMRTNIFRLHAKSEKKQEKNNKIVSAGQWKDASEFEGLDTSLENCIYYLASEPEDDKPSYLYIGEAKNSGGRLKRKIIDGKAYIGHQERNHDYYKYKFTRYRIDQISSIEALHNAQDAMIGAFEMADCSVFKNGFKITNEQFNKAYSYARNKKNS